MRNILLCALALVVPASAFAAGAYSRSITLNVSYDSGGFSCEYTGGDNSDGDVTFHVGTRASVALHLTGDRSYTIYDVSVKSDPNQQLTFPAHASTNAVIQDKNTVAQTAAYKVTVKDPDTGDSIPCDPKIINN